MGSPEAILALAMDQPKLSDISNTILVLKEIGALLRTNDGVLDDRDGELTFVGRIMAALPLNIRYSRLIVLGYCFSILEECIIIAAGLNVQGLFSNSLRDSMASFSRKLEWSNGSGSDLIAILNAYRVWNQRFNDEEKRYNADKRNEEILFCQRHFLEIKSLHECSTLIVEIKNRLEKMNIKELTGYNRAIWKTNEKSIILKVVIAGAFYPQFFAWNSHENHRFASEVFNTLHGRDPCNTVYYTGFDDTHIRQLYTSSIKDLLGDIVANKRDVKVSLEENTRKVYVTFKQQNKDSDAKDDWITSNSTVPGKVVAEVYKAVKLRRLGVPQNIKVLR